MFIEPVIPKSLKKRKASEKAGPRKVATTESTTKTSIDEKVPIVTEQYLSTVSQKVILKLII